MTRPITRLPAKLPVAAMQTYSIASPVATHTRAATCTEVDCPTQAAGWQTIVDEATDLGQKQAAYIRGDKPYDTVHHGRSFTETRDGALTVFTFAPGQECFTPHRVPLDRPEFYVIRGGDWRGTTSQPREFSSPDSWVNHFGDTLDTIRKAVE